MTGRNCEAVAREQPHRKRDMDIASYLRINDQAGLGSHKCARSRSGKVVKHIAGLGVPTESQQSAAAIIILAQQGLFLPDWRCTMSRVHIIYLNRSCVQLYIFICVYHINLFAAEWRIELSQLMHSAWLKRSSKTLY